MAAGRAGSGERAARAIAPRTPRAGVLLGLLVSCALGACVVVSDRDGSRSEPFQPSRPTHYTVLPGDTLYAIAFRLKLDWRDLARWNKLDNPSLIHPGQRLALQAPRGAKASTKRVAKAGKSKASRSASTTGPSASSPPQRAQRKAAAPTSRAATTSDRVATSLTWRWPASGPLLATFSDPAEAGRGIDVGGKQGDGVRAAAAGRVVYTGSGLRYYGNLVIIKHDDTFLSAYGYNDALLVAQGDEVQAGQRIARMGLGPGKQPRLHFEIRVNGKPVDPLRYLPSRGR